MSSALASIPLRDLIEWADNPRRTHDPVKHTELVASIRSRGLLQPLLVRPTGDAYEVIAGNRRRRALVEPDETGAVDLDQLVPCLVRELSNSDAIAAALKENGDRDGLPPLEEADAYARLLASAGSIDEVAAMVGRSATHVRQRLRLQRLVPLARRLVAEGHLSLAAAVRLAQVESPVEQIEVLADSGVAVGLFGEGSAGNWRAGHEAVAALTEFDEATWAALVEQSDHPGPRAIEHAIESTGRRLKRARFNILDTELGAVACTECPRRTGAQGSLFATMGDDDSCLDAACWDAKGRAVDERRIVDAKAAGKLYTQEDTKGWWSKYGGQVTSDWSEVAENGDTFHRLTDDERRQLITAIDHKGALHQMLPALTYSVVRARLLAENAPAQDDEGDEEGDDSDAEQKRAEMRRELQRKQAEAVALREREEAELREVQSAVLAGWASASKEQWAQVTLLVAGSAYGRGPLRRALSLKAEDSLEKVVAHLRVHGADTLERMAYRVLLEVMRLDQEHYAAALDLLGLGTWDDVAKGKPAPKKPRKRAGTAASARAEGGAE
jgi:ParB family chromosome partitioning protein